MSEYRVYRSRPARTRQGGRRRGAGAAGRGRRLARGARPEPAARGAGLRALVIWAAVAVAAALATALVLVLRPRHARQLPRRLRPRQALGQSPRLGAGRRPVIAVAIVAAVTAYLAFGRHLAVKLVGVAVVVVRARGPRAGARLGERHGEHRRRSARRAGRRGHETEKELRPPCPGKPMNILLIGSRQGPARRPRALRHADPRAPRPRDQEHLHALGAARPARRHPGLRLRQDQRGLRLRRAGRSP